jgi:hypothetical protein
MSDDRPHRPPTQFPTEDVVTSEPLETEDGEVVIRQHTQGPENLGSGEFPDPDTPARGPAPGAGQPTVRGVGEDA